jgi:AF2212-like protein
MTKTIEAIFDGETLRPDEPLDLPANTRVRLTIEIAPTPETPPTPGTWGSWLDAALSAHLSGPPDWSRNLEDYLYGDKTRSKR